MSINASTRVWDGVYRSFAEIPYESDVFEDEVWTMKIVARAQALLADARVAGAALPRASETTEYALPFVAAAAARPTRRLGVLDFGGGLATSYIPLRAMLPTSQRLHFVVVDNPAVCRIGADMFAADADIRFETAIPAGETFDIVHAGSSIHYVDNWRGTIATLGGCSAEYLLFADLPAGDIETFVTAQSFHGKRIPVRFWNLAEFTGAVIEEGFDLVMSAAYRGNYLDRGASLPTAHFDSRHRLDQFCQLVFRRRPAPQR